MIDLNWRLIMRPAESFIVILLFSVAIPILLSSRMPDSGQTDLDERVRTFLKNHQVQWMDLNIPMRDGQFLYDLIIEHGYTHALEIGTSTGHSAIWIAWALSKTGGKLITIEIDESRYREALSNFREAGVSDYIDARLADAHELVKELDGPFDFVFSDADKDWYKQYFIDVAPKVSEGGCFTAHNIQRRSRVAGIREFVEYIMGRRDFQTTIETDRSTGISVSYKKPVKK
jgi:caffeoyl-CoA O-methyltransferase